jgi:hypothetical protein
MAPEAWAFNQVTAARYSVTHNDEPCLPSPVWIAKSAVWWFNRPKNSGGGALPSAYRRPVPLFRR